MLKRIIAPLLGKRAEAERDVPVQPAPALDYSSDAARLAEEIEKLAPNDAVHLLAALKRGLEPHSSEFERYLSAEALTTAIYPKFKFSEFARIFLEDEAFLAYYKKFMDVGNWHSLDRKYAMKLPYPHLHIHITNLEITIQNHIIGGQLRLSFHDCCKSLVNDVRSKNFWERLDTC